MKTKKVRIWDGAQMHYHGVYQIESYSDPLRGFQIKEYFFPFDGIESGEVITGNAVEIKASMDFSGLKDKNGKEIYEGDIITTPTRFVHDTLDAIGTVQYLGTGFTSVGFGDFAGAHYQIQYDSEVLGNIYENPELLNTNA